MCRSGAGVRWGERPEPGAGGVPLRSLAPDAARGRDEEDLPGSPGDDPARPSRRAGRRRREVRLDARAVPGARPGEHRSAPPRRGAVRRHLDRGVPAADPGMRARFESVATASTPSWKLDANAASRRSRDRYCWVTRLMPGVSEEPRIQDIMQTCRSGRDGVARWVLQRFFARDVKASLRGATAELQRVGCRPAREPRAREGDRPLVRGPPTMGEAGISVHISPCVSPPPGQAQSLRQAADA